MKNKNIIRIALTTAFILLIPLVGNYFVDGWNWTLLDFVFAGALLFGTGLTYDLVARKAGNIAFRAAVGITLAAAFLLIWINGAVGIIGSEDNPANLMYGGVLTVGFIGAIITRLKPHGMARVLFARALAQTLVPVIALIIRRPDFSPGVVLVFGLNALFVMLFIGSALLFRHAARTPNGPGVKSTT